ncbi:hypothetical protein CV019_16585, partial [Staphylococcus haemolyticus]
MRGRTTHDDLGQPPSSTYAPLGATSTCARRSRTPRLRACRHSPVREPSHAARSIDQVPTVPDHRPGPTAMAIPHDHAGPALAVDRPARRQPGANRSDGRGKE